ncbi:MAG: hypothetical protein SR3Q1_10695 [Quinella sp. 3Q1]|nr:hypothetical protein [Quinella sp. 3Q1]MBR3051927.1 hypothetical protein [Selenomonadaceae bacterium]
MATREDNIKKIDTALEAMSDEELDQVAGGTWAETAADSRFLNSLNGSTDRYGALRIAFTPGSKIQEEIKNGWAKVGITFTAHNGAISGNEYYLGTKKITQSEARRHAMEHCKKFMDVKDWDW